MLSSSHFSTSTQQCPHEYGDQHDRLADPSGKPLKVRGGLPTIAETDETKNHAEERRRYLEAIPAHGAVRRFLGAFCSSSTLNTASGMNPSRFGILTFGKLSLSSFPSSGKSPFRFKI